MIQLFEYRLSQIDDANKYNIKEVEMQIDENEIAAATAAAHNKKQRGSGNDHHDNISSS